MANAVILFEHWSDTATLFGGSYRSELPLANVKDRDLAVVARTTNAAAASTIIQFDLGRTQRIDGLALGVPNISPGATWRWRLYDTLAMLDGDAFFDTGVETLPGIKVPSLSLPWRDPWFWNGINRSNLLDEIPNFLYADIPPGSVPDDVAQYGKLELFDAANANGYLDFSRLLVSRGWRPSINYDEDNAFSLVPLGDMEESLGGKRTYGERGIRRTMRMTFRHQAGNVLQSDVYRMMVKARDSRQVFVVQDPAEVLYLQQRMMIATFRQVPAIQQALVARGHTAVDLEQVL